MDKPCLTVCEFEPFPVQVQRLIPASVLTRPALSISPILVELASLVEQAKNNCKSLGFEEGTEKFTDCSLKLYTQSVELAAKENEKIVQSQSSGTNKTTIYDPARESRVLINKGQRMISGACTLGIDC